jgi:hypothetical protein
MEANIRLKTTLSKRVQLSARPSALGRVLRPHGGLSSILVRASLATVGAAFGRSRRARPRRFHISDDGLPTVIDVDVLDPDMLVAAVSQTTESLDLYGRGAQQSRRSRCKGDNSRLATTAPL